MTPWQTVPLGELGEQPPRRDPRKEGEGVFDYIDISAVDNLAHRVVAPKRLANSDAPSRARHSTAPGDVLVSLVRPYLKNVAIVPDGLTNPVASSAFCVLRPTNRVTAAFLFYGLLRDEFIASIRTYGDTPPAARDSEFLELPFPVPPLAVQDAIVEQIEKQLSRLRVANQSAMRARGNTRRYQAAVHTAAIAGRLLHPRSIAESATTPLLSLGVESIDDGEQLPPDWARARLGDLVRIGSGATPKKDRREFYDGGTIPWVTSGALNEEVVSEPTAYITERALRETSVKLWPAHTLLVAMYGEGRTRGKCSELLFDSTTNQACAALVFTEATMPLQPWIKMYLTATYEDNRRRALGGVQPNLSLGFIKDIVIPIPPLNEQEAIVQEVSRLKSIGATAERALALSESRGKALARTILADAYQGSLVSGMEAA